MHLLEGTLAAFDAFQETSWFELAQELVDLFLGKFLCSRTGGIAEYYDERLEPLYSNGLFVIEPGHHYEWAWLLMKYRQLLRRSGHPIDHRIDPAITTILQFANKFGVNHDTNLVVDEIYSNGRIKETSFRMWPQTERMKYEAARSPAEDGAAAAGIAAVWQLISGAPPVFGTNVSMPIDTLSRFLARLPLVSSDMRGVRGRQSGHGDQWTRPPRE